MPPNSSRPEGRQPTDEPSGIGQPEPQQALPPVAQPPNTSETDPTPNTASSDDELSPTPDPAPVVAPPRKAKARRQPPWWRRLAARHDLRLLPAAATVWLATLLGVAIGWAWTLATGLALATLALAMTRTRTRPIRVAAWAVVICGLLTAGWTGARLHHQATNPLAELASKNASAQLRVTVTDLPKPIMSAGFAGRPGGVRSVLVPAEATSITHNHTTTPADGTVLLIAPARTWAHLVRGQQLTATGELTPPLPSSSDRPVAVVRVRGAPTNVTPPSPTQRAAEALRQGLRSASAGLPDVDRGLLPAIVIGDRTGVTPPVLDDFRLSGMDYLMAVGGLHFMVVCGAVLWLLRRIGVGPRICAITTGVVLLGFAEVAGGQPNVLRAGLMVGVGLLGLAAGRTRSACSALAGSIIVLTLWQPAFAADVGFALSVLATAAMVLSAKPTAKALERHGVPAGIAELLAVALVAQLATAPVIAAAYGQFSLPSILANLLVEPAFVPAMLVGALAMACSVVWPWLATVIAHVAVPELAWLRFVSHHAAALPGASIHWPTGWWGGLALASILAAIVVALRFRRLRTLMAAILVGVFVIVVPVRILAPGWPPRHWAMIDCDVGQGDGEVLATGQPGQAVVIDTGPDEIAIDQCLNRLDVNRIPLVVLSHLHADHVGGLAAVLRDRTVGAVAVGPSRVPAWAWTQVAREAAAARVPLVELSPGQRLAWPGLALDVLGPAPAMSWPSGDDPSGTVVNNSSLVLRATTPVGRVLLTGDVELAAQADLLESGVDLNAAVLKVPHHGSRFSAPTFLDAVHARIAVASVGQGNPYGHPSPLTLHRLASDGALVLRTDHDGDVAIVPGPNGPVAVRRGDPRSPPLGTAHRPAHSATG